MAVVRQVCSIINSMINLRAAKQPDESRIMVSKNQSIVVQGVEIHLFSHNQEDYISLTDMVSGFESGSSLIEAWLRNKNTIEFIGGVGTYQQPEF